MERTFAIIGLVTYALYLASLAYRRIYLPWRLKKITEELKRSSETAPRDYEKILAIASSFRQTYMSTLCANNKDYPNLKDAFDHVEQSAWERCINYYIAQVVRFGGNFSHLDFSLQTLEKICERSHGRSTERLSSIVYRLKNGQPIPVI